MKNLLTIILLLTSSLAQAWPDKHIRYVLPSAPGGGNDIVTRIIARHLEKELKQSIIVDNRPGGSGQIALTIMQNAQPDGYTIMNMGEGFTDKELGDRGLEAITYSAQQPFTVTINKQTLPTVSNVKQLIETIKQKPDNFLWGSNGIQSTIYDGSTQFLKLYNLQARHVPYKGGATVIMAVISGETHLLWTGLAPMLPYLTNDRVKILAVTGERRHSLAPNLPTFREQGFPEYNYHVQFRVVMHKRAPHNVKQKIVRVVQSIPESVWTPLGLTGLYEKSY